MKKLVIAVCAVVMSVGSVFAVGEVNVKAGLDIGAGGTFYGNSESKESQTLIADPSYSYSNKNINNVSGDTLGFTLGAEYLYPILSSLKIGAGFEYLVPRNANVRFDHSIPKFDEKAIDFTVGYLPIYVTAQTNPLSAIPEIYVKGNVGYSMFFLNWNKDKKLLFGDDTKETIGGGVYVQLATGYEFASGLILELSWTYITSSAEYKRDEGDDFVDATYTEKYDLTFRKIGITAGYKFKL
jgi:hypothetical protein